MRRKLDAAPDRIDVRDWIYQPTLSALPDEIVNCDSVPGILDQGHEGACTGFALAAVINFLLARRNRQERVSPYMLYCMARRYDEWPGQNYEGSSARGGMKGWVAHGVCLNDSWKSTREIVLDETLAKESQRIPGGAYYRVAHRQIRDMHCALTEVGILYATLMVHDGWSDLTGGKTQEITYVENGNLRTRDLPVIERKGMATDGHAIAIVGYTRDGFIIQNSWGKDWGSDGFALLPYEDFFLHTTDVWVAQLGVPIGFNTWREQGPNGTIGLGRAAASIPLSDIRPYVIDVGNNGKLSDSGTYWTTRDDLKSLVTTDIPKQTQAWEKKRILLYLHGGLNDELAAAKRVVAFKEVLLANEIYPLHVMWESGAMESIRNIIEDFIKGSDQRAGGWLHDFRDHLIEAKDRTFELTTSRAGKALWGEMKENAGMASTGPQGAMELFCDIARQAIGKLKGEEKAKWEIHVVGHSAGSIFCAYALPLLLDSGLALKTVQLMAPAITIDLFKSSVLKLIKNGSCPTPTMYLLSDVGERDDTVGPYGKSLLYLVSNAFEEKYKMPILGMERFSSADGVAGGGDTDPEVAALFKGGGAQPNLVVAGRNGGFGSVSRSDSHGGFDNDVETMNSVLARVLGAKAPGDVKRLFTTRDLQY